MRDAADLVRIRRGPGGALQVAGGGGGRGAWLCRGSVSCFEAAVRRSAFSRAFRAAIDRADLEALRDRLAESARMEEC